MLGCGAWLWCSGPVEDCGRRCRAVGMRGVCLRKLCDAWNAETMVVAGMTVDQVLNAAIVLCGVSACLQVRRIVRLGVSACFVRSLSLWRPRDFYGWDFANRSVQCAIRK